MLNQRMLLFFFSWWDGVKQLVVRLEIRDFWGEQVFQSDQTSGINVMDGRDEHKKKKRIGINEHKRSVVRYARTASRVK